MLTIDEIALLREIAKWRRNHKVSYFQWRPRQGLGVFTEWKMRDPHGLVVNVTYEPDRTHVDDPEPQVAATRNYYGSEPFRVLPGRTVTETIDCLAALGYLPLRFSSAYRAGWDASAVWHDEDSSHLRGEFKRLFGDPENISFPAVESAW